MCNRSKKNISPRLRGDVRGVEDFGGSLMELIPSDMGVSEIEAQAEKVGAHFTYICRPCYPAGTAKFAKVVFAKKQIALSELFAL